MRLNLNVPFAEKDEAKQLGARWDAARKVWYIEGKEDLKPFARWLSSDNQASQSPRAMDATTQTFTGMTIRGRDYAEYPRVCNCPPWEDCEKCRDLNFQIKEK